MAAIFSGCLVQFNQMVKRPEFRTARDRLKSMLEVLSDAVGRGFEVNVVKTESGGKEWFCAVMMLLEGGDRTVFLSGRGNAKSEAVERVLQNWEKGFSEPYAPAAGSSEELKLKLAAAGRVMKS